MRKLFQITFILYLVFVGLSLYASAQPLPPPQPKWHKQRTSLPPDCKQVGEWYWSIPDGKPRFCTVIGIPGTWSFMSSSGTGVLQFNGLTGDAQSLATGTAGTNFSVSSSGSVHTFNLPTASATNTGKLSAADWLTFNGKQAADSDLTVFSGLAPPDDHILQRKSGAWANRSLAQFKLDLGYSFADFLPALTGQTGKVLSNNGSALSWVTVGAGDALTSNSIAQFAPVASAALALEITDETGTDNAVFSTSPQITTPTFSGATTFSSLTGAASRLAILNSSGVLQSFANATAGDCLRGDLTWAACGSGTGGVASFNGLTGTTQNFSTAATGTDFSINSTGTTHEFNFPFASAVANGKLSSSDWTLFNSKAGTASPIFSGDARAVTPTAGDSDTSIATTNFVTTADALKANINSQTFTGTPTLPTGTIAVTQAAGNSSTAVATTNFVTSADALKANVASPIFSGDARSVTPPAGDSDTSIATTNFVASSVINERAASRTLSNVALTNPQITSISNVGTITLPTATDILIGRNTADELKNKTATDPTNNITANGLRTASGTVAIASALAPVSGQVLTATGANTAAWQDSASAGVTPTSADQLTNKTIDGSATGNVIINTTAKATKVGTELVAGCPFADILSIPSYGLFYCRTATNWEQIPTFAGSGTTANQIFRRNAANTDWIAVDLVGVGVNITHSDTATTITATGGSGGGSSATGAPVASNVAFTGTQQVGSDLTRSFTRTDAEGDAAGTPVDQWYRADAVTFANQTPIAGANAPVYTLTSGDLGKVVRPSVIPTSVTGATTGGQVFGNWSNAITAAGGGGGTQGAATLDNPGGTGGGLVIEGNDATMTATGADPQLTNFNISNVIASQPVANSYYEVKFNNVANGQQVLFIKTATGAPHASGDGWQVLIVNSNGNVSVLFQGDITLFSDGTSLASDVWRLGFNNNRNVEVWKNGSVVFTSEQQVPSGNFVGFGELRSYGAVNGLAVQMHDILFKQ